MKPARKIWTKINSDKYSDRGNQILTAVEQLVDFVKVTLGPKTRHILVDMGYKTELMDDGRFIAGEFELADEFEDAVISYVKEATKKQDDKAGDGTTTTMVLLGALLRNVIESGKTYPEIKRELESAVSEAAIQLKAASVTVDSEEVLYQVAKTSINDEDIARIIAKVIWMTGAKGAVTITDSTSRGVEFERTEGFVFGRGLKARGMITNKEKQAYEAPNKNFTGPVGIWVTEQLIATADDISPILNNAEKSGYKNIAIFCPNLIGEALGVVAMAQMRAYANIVAVQLPGEGDKARDFVQDICTVTGAKAGEEFGVADGVVSTLDDTTIIGGHGEKAEIEALIAYVQEKIEQTKDDYDREYLHLRQARLQGGVVIIKVGGLTETEVRLRIKKVEDAVNSSKCALEEGIVPGAGISLFRLETSSQELNSALQEITNTVVENANFEWDSAGEMGAGDTMNVLTGEIGSFLEVGVVDAVKVLRCAVENACSIASILFSVSGIITSERDYGSDKKS